MTVHLLGLSCRWAALTVAVASTSCSVANTPVPLEDVLPGTSFLERVFHSPGGQTRIEQWSDDKDPAPLVVRAKGYVSGLSLAPGLALVFHANLRIWMLSVRGQLTPLSALQTDDHFPPPLPLSTPIMNRYVFEHDGRQWQLAILSRQDPRWLPGVATEQERSLDVLLWRTPFRR